MVAWFAPFLTSVWWHIGKYEIKNIFSKSFKSLYFWLGIWVQGPYFDGKNTLHSLSMFITTSELCGFGIGFGIGRKYRPITVSVSVSGRNQNYGFGRSLTLIDQRYSILHAHEDVCSLIIDKLSFWVLMSIPEWRIKLGSYRSQMSDANFVPQRCCCVLRVFLTINFNASDLILILTNLSSSHGDRFKSLQYPFNLNVVLENPIIA